MITILLGIGIVVGSGGDPVTEVAADVEVVVAKVVVGAVEAARFGTGSEYSGESDGDFFVALEVLVFFVAVADAAAVATAFKDDIVDGDSCLIGNPGWMSLFGVGRISESGGGASLKSSIGGCIESGNEFWLMTGFLGLIKGVAAEFV